MAEARFIVRFGKSQRIQHGLMMISFLGLAATGLPLLFSEAAWARVLARVFGGFTAAGLFHRLFAIVLIGVFLFHVGWLTYRIFVRRERNMLWGPTSMVPQPRDLVELYQHVKWFLRVGQRPQFDRYTYWEKFDYWAVFWGMFIIGGSGLLLWFPELFSRAVPGWIFNIAMLIHGEEALLAVGFIFTIHFFNGHLRPEKFPMDLVIFTGRVSEHEFRNERALEAARLEAKGELDRHFAPAPSPRLLRWGRLGGTIAVLVGLSLFVMILFAFFAR
ncbi:MAG TPA: cytochrome b/b6 domain-containing protein [Vicinamibacterales bacterium]|nr:cytochrome b/b6 domain-containing protein [Vicinamibacterales bacterium]